MSDMYCIDLVKYLNHKLIYKNMPKSKNEVGIENIWILDSSIKLREKEFFNDVEFKFNSGKYDNVRCLGQEIEIDNVASKLHIIGFAYWGDTKEYFKLIYEDDSFEMLNIPFIDWSHEPYDNSWYVNYYGNNISTIKVVMTSGEKKMLAHFQHSICDIKGNKKIKKMILPNNTFTHILAITLEK